MKIKVLLLSAVSVLLVSSAGVAKEKCSNSSDWTVGPIIGGWVATCNANNTQLNCALDNGIMNVVNAGGLGPQACSTTKNISGATSSVFVSNCANCYWQRLDCSNPANTKQCPTYTTCSSSGHWTPSGYMQYTCSSHNAVLNKTVNVYCGLNSVSSGLGVSLNPSSGNPGNCGSHMPNPSTCASFLTKLPPL